MRFAPLVLLACCGSATSPVVTVHEAPRDAERQAAAALAKHGRLERAVAAFTAANVKSPETRAQTWAAEIDALGALFRCDEVRDLAATIDAGGDAEAKAAAKTAREECARVRTIVTEPQEALMRGIFHRAADFEPNAARDAGTIYEQAWEIAPTLAALLGLARTATLRGDAALAERTYERALAYAERSDQKARVAIGPVGSGDGLLPAILDVNDTSALAAFGPLLVMQDLATGALRVVGSLPIPWTVLAGHADRAVISRDGHARILRIGLDEPRTSTPTELGVGTTVFSPDGALVAQVAGATAVIVDALTGQTIARTPLRSTEASVVGFADGHVLVVSKPTELCTMTAPDWACVTSKDLEQNARRPATVRGHVLAFQPNANSFVVFDLAQKHVITTLQGHFSSVDDLVLTPDASTLLSVSERRTVVWDLATRKRVDMIFTRVSPNFTPDGTRYVDRSIDALVVNASSFPTPNVVAAGAFMPSTPNLEFEPDGKLAVRDSYGDAVVDLATRKTRWTAHDVAPRPRAIVTASSTDLKWFAGLKDGLVLVNYKTMLEVGPDAAVFTEESGHAWVSGNEASVRCAVGDAWLPLEACRDRLLSR